MSPGLKVVFLVFLLSFMLQSGLAAPKGSLANASRRARELVLAVVLMLVLGPILAVGVGRVFGLAGPAAAALLVLSVVGVVPLAPRAAKNARGDVPLAIVVMLVLSLVAAFAATPATRLLLSYWGFDALVGVQPGSFVLALLLLQVVPLATGLALRARAARSAWLEKAVGVVNTAAFVAIVLFVVAPRLGDMKALGIRGAAAGLVFAVVLAALGWTLGGPTPTGRRTLAAMANMPNFALALALASSAYAPPVYAVTLIEMFLLRIAVGIVIQLVLARSARGAPAAYPPAREARSAGAG